jgi:hypothetical protein
MFLYIVGLGVNHEVIHVDYHDLSHICKYLIHHYLKCGQQVAYPKVHYNRFKGPLMTNKGYPPFITFLDVNIVVSPSEIYLCKPL